MTMSAVLALNGCGTLDQPRSPERQARSDQCWAWGNDSALLMIPAALGKAFVCPINDLTRGQPQVGGGEFSAHTLITPGGTYQVITNGNLTTVSKTAK